MISLETLEIWLNAPTENEHLEFEVYQLPAPDFRVGEVRTTTILFAHQDFSDMSQSDRVRACYQHCCLKYLCNEKMSNQTIRDRFNLNKSKGATVSSIISATKEAGLVK